MKSVRFIFQQTPCQLLLPYNWTQLNTVYCKRSCPPTFLSYLAFQSTDKQGNWWWMKWQALVLACAETIYHNPFYTLSVKPWLHWTQWKLLFYSAKTCANPKEYGVFYQGFWKPHIIMRQTFCFNYYEKIWSFIWNCKLDEVNRKTRE